MDATQHREKAAQLDQQASDSFDRCDTDGCVSQFCDSLTAREHRLAAKIIENGGLDSFCGLWEGDRRVKARIINTRFGQSWLLHDDEVELIKRRGKQFLPTGKKSRILRELGLAEKIELAPARAGIHGTGKGFSGLTSCRVIAFRTGCKWGTDAILKN